MQKVLAAVAALGAVMGIAGTAHANIVYTINQTSTTPEVSGELSPLSDTITGTITTDGAIGFLQTSDIVSYDLQINDNIRPQYDVHLTPSNSGIVSDSGNGLMASTTGLSFDFSTPNAYFGIQGTSYGFYSGYQYLCFAATTGACIAGETIVPYYYAVDGALTTGLSGTLPLSGGSGGTPEVATWAMMLLGFGGLGAVMRARRSMVHVSA
jgi:hypothetical protein